MQKAVFITMQGNAQKGQPFLNKSYNAETQALLAAQLDFLPPVFSLTDLAARADLREADYIFSTWGMPALDEAQLAEGFPQLKAVFYAAGTVQDFARAFFVRGVRIFCAAAANAVPVAEFTTAQIILANKGFFAAPNLFRAGGWSSAKRHCEAQPGNYGARVGLLGAGMIGKRVIALLRNYNLPMLVFDPFLPDETARELQVQKAELSEIFASCNVISNHLANNAQTRGMLNYALFSRMLPTAAFLNTGRGAQVVEMDLVRAMQEEPGRTAVLDVTDPEPPLPGHPFYSLPNVFLTPHTAGSTADEVARMGEYMAAAFAAYRAGEQSELEVTLPMLETMA